jgi:4-hydroxybenzoate polyprenyltransferase
VTIQGTSGLVGPGLARPARRIRFELLLSWRFIRDDSIELIGSLVLFSAGAWRSLHLPVADLPLILAKAFVYGWLFIAVHTLSNQATGSVADARDKPHRPIPAGLVSVRGAAYRFAVMLALFIAVGVAFGVALLTAAAAALMVWHNYLRGDRHWAGRNFYNMALTFVGLAAAWRLAGPLTHTALSWDAMSTGYLLLIFLQDLRDIEGDRLTDRRTIPLVLGDTGTRLVGATLLSLAPAVTSGVQVLLLGIPVGPVTIGWSIANYLVNWCLAARLLLWRSAKSDRLTYKIYIRVGFGVLLLSAPLIWP